MQWIGALAFNIFAIDKRDRYLGAVFRSGKEPFRSIELAIKASWDLLLLQQDRNATLNVIFVDGTGRHQRLIAIAILACFEFSIGLGMGTINWLWEAYISFFAALRTVAREAINPQLWQAFRSFTSDVERGEEIDIFKHQVRTMRQQLGPVLFLDGVYGRRD